MCLKVQTYNDLPDKMKQENVRQVGELLRLVGRPRVAHINYINVVNDLIRSTTAGTPVALFTEGFAMLDQNLRAGSSCRRSTTERKSRTFGHS